MLPKHVGTIEAVLFSVIEKEHRRPAGPPVRDREVSHELEERDDAHAVVRGTGRGRHRVIVRREEHGVRPRVWGGQRRICPVDFDEDVCALEVDCVITDDVRRVRGRVVGEVDVRVLCGDGTELG